MRSGAFEVGTSNGRACCTRYGYRNGVSVRRGANRMRQGGKPAAAQGLAGVSCWGTGGAGAPAPAPVS